MQVHDSGSRKRISRWFYAQDVAAFKMETSKSILGALVETGSFDVTALQRDAWLSQIDVLRSALSPYVHGRIYFEYEIPRLGRRIDVLLILGHVIFVLEFKTGGSRITLQAIDQVWDYALDLRNFHETSHHAAIASILVVTEADPALIAVTCTPDDPSLSAPICIGSKQIREALAHVLECLPGTPIEPDEWEKGRYSPTPTIIEAARALYSRHSVDAIARSDAGARNLSKTAAVVEGIIDAARTGRRKALCLVTGVPGAGKTLVGLNAATRHRDRGDVQHSVFLSGNGPLVKVLKEALARDAVAQAQSEGRKLSKSEARSQVGAFIQNVHHFRDEYLRDQTAPADHVALFDEAQRAWDLAQTRFFMKQKKGVPDFNQSEPEFLISCLDRHEDWGVVVGLVDSGQEINTGEAGVSEWVESVLRSFPTWEIHLSPRLRSTEYLSESVQEKISQRAHWHEDLHLSTSMRSFRAERMSDFVQSVLSMEVETARTMYSELRDRYPIYLTRNLHEAKDWIRRRARGSERYGLVASSQAQRLKPHAINVRTTVDPVHWFLNDKSDVRSSYYLEDPATEFLVQGLELDWACIVWDGDLRHTTRGWTHNEFRGAKWIRIKKDERRRYLENAYRVLLTRARQGMVIVVPEGVDNDPTRSPSHYDSTFNYLLSLGIIPLVAYGTSQQ
ncbi:MAG: DUF2075 domain-containing protein [Arenimonas sp.]